MSLLATVSLVALGALAHKPTYTQGGHATMQEAFPVDDPDVSIVLYHPVTCDAPSVWLGFRIDDPRDVFVQLGVPVIDRLDDYAPTVAVLAPGLPEPAGSTPFELPEGYGALVIDTDTSQRGAFFEPFTGTHSHVLFEGRVDLPEPGVVYVVAWHPEQRTGKLWVAVGDIEQFTAEDFENAGYWMQETQKFHETGPYAPDTPPVESVCAPSPDTTPDAGAADDEATDGAASQDTARAESAANTDDAGAGVVDTPNLSSAPSCATGSGPPSSLAGLLVLLVVGLVGTRRPLRGQESRWR